MMGYGLSFDFFLRSVESYGSCIYVFYVAYGSLLQKINRKKIIHGSLRDDTFFISYILFPEFYLTVKLLCNLFSTLLYVAFLVNKCICATSFFFVLQFFFNLFLIEGKLLHNIVLASAVHQDESAIGMRVFSLSNLPPTSHPSRLLQSPGLSSLSHTANFHWLSVLHMVVYMLPC